jgi:hypothetical protein
MQEQVISETSQKEELEVNFNTLLADLEGYGLLAAS